MVYELLLVEITVIRPVFGLVEIEEEMLIGNSVQAEETLLGIRLGALDSVDGGDFSHVLAGPMADHLVRGELGIQIPIAPVGVRLDGGLNADVLPEHGLEFGPGGVGH